LTLLPGSFLAAAPRPAWSISFTDVTNAAGVNYTHGYNSANPTYAMKFAGGVAAGDFDADGDIDLYCIRGDIGANLLFRNNGDGTFTNIAAEKGVSMNGALANAPLFGDFNGDRRLDLYVGGVSGQRHTLFRHDTDGIFRDVTVDAGLNWTQLVSSAAYADPDEDGDLDLFLTHWGLGQGSYGHYWRNTPAPAFWYSMQDTSVGFDVIGDDLQVFTFTPNWSDIDNDGDLDLLLTSDEGNSEIWRNDGSATFTNITDRDVITDTNGMGAAVGDYDNDGDMDWFVTSIMDVPPQTYRNGNRLYRNEGGGVFSDATDIGGVRSGGFAWGASFQDFDNDGNLDIFHVNGWPVANYMNDPARLFMSNGDGTFTEMSAAYGLVHTAMGRGIVCFDYDRDGDIDIFIACNSGPSSLFRNEGGNTNNWITITLKDNPPNWQATGARIYVELPSGTQMREIRAGSNYVSQDPVEAHFGLGNATSITELTIVWPDGTTHVYNDYPVNLFVTIEKSGITDVSLPETDSLPSGIMLVGAAPNPMRSSTEIRYRVPTAAEVRIRIFDAAGRAVRTLISPRAAAGEAALVWDGAAEDRRPVPSGVYPYVIESLGKSARGRLTIVR
jgi:hypothetical protein